MYRRIATSSIFVTALFLAGCSTVKQKAATETDMQAFTASISTELKQHEATLQGPLGFEESLSRAITHNFEIQVRMREAGLAEIDTALQSGGMLPNLIASSDYFGRDRLAKSHSSLSNTYSTSSNLHSLSSDISISYSLLDFGLSYFRAKQSANKALQKREEIRIVKARIAEQTTTAFWRAVALRDLQQKMPVAQQAIKNGIALAKSAAADASVDPASALENQRQFLSLQSSLSQSALNIAGADEQLKQLIGMPTIGHLQLNQQRNQFNMIDKLPSAKHDVVLALQQRPELHQSYYDKRIDADEVYVQVTQLIPGLQLNSKFNDDRNSYLLDNNWLSWGASLSGNLINLVKLPTKLQSIEAQKELTHQRALATAATIAMQVHVARAKFTVHRQIYEDQRSLANVQHKQLEQAMTNARLGSIGEQDLLQYKINALLADVKVNLDFAEMSAAYLTYLTARGDTPY